MKDGKADVDENSAKKKKSNILSFDELRKKHESLDSRKALIG